MFWLVAALTITLVLPRNVLYDEWYMTTLRWLTQEKPHDAIPFAYETRDQEVGHLPDHRSSCTAATAALDVPTMAVTPSLPGCQSFPLSFQ